MINVDDFSRLLLRVRVFLKPFIDTVTRFFCQKTGMPSYLIRDICTCFLICFLVCLPVYTVRFTRKIVIRAKVDKLANNALELSVGQFLAMRKVTYGAGSRKSIALDHDFAGVYILHNTTKDKYYVGQSQEVFKRVYQHYSGSGNGDVYADYCRGDQFTVKMIALKNSGFSSLNELERHAINRYDAYTRGYNKTHGNRG